MHANEIANQFVVQQRPRRRIICFFISGILNLIAHCVCTALHSISSNIELKFIDFSLRVAFVLLFKRCERAICSNNCIYLTKRTVLLNAKNIAMIYRCHFSAAVFFYLCWFLLKTSVWTHWMRSTSFAPDSAIFNLKTITMKETKLLSKKRKNQTIECCANSNRM